MNMDPSNHPEGRIPDYEREIIITDDASGAAASSMMITIIGVIAAVALLAVVVAWSPWAGGGNGGGNVTPGQGGEDTAPAPSRRLPDQQNPTQPQIVPTTITSPR